MEAAAAATAAATAPAWHSQWGLETPGYVFLGPCSGLGKGRPQRDTPVGRGLTPPRSTTTRSEVGDGMRDGNDFSFKTRAQRIGKSCFMPNRTSCARASVDTGLRGEKRCVCGGRCLIPSSFKEPRSRAATCLLLEESSSYGKGPPQSTGRERCQDFAQGLQRGKSQGGQVLWEGLMPHQAGGGHMGNALGGRIAHPTAAPAPALKEPLLSVHSGLNHSSSYAHNHTGQTT